MGRFSDKKQGSKGSLASLKDKADKDNADINKDSNGNANDNINADTNKIILKKEKSSNVELVGVYLKGEQIKKLNELAKKSNKNKSEIARLAIDYLYDNVEIQ